MTEWISMEDKEKWLNSPSKVEILCDDGSIIKFVTAEKSHKDGSDETRLFFDAELLDFTKQWTHWRAMK